MKNRKSLAAGITAAALVSAIGLAYAQSDDPNAPAEPIDTAAQVADQQQTPPVTDTLTPQDQQQQQQSDATQQKQDGMANSTSQADLQTDTTSAPAKAYNENPAPTYGTSSDTVERAPRADRN